MSFSQPKSENPCSKFIEFRDGNLSYYDKKLEQNVLLPLPVYFIVLDELSTITGYNELNNCGIFSNEVHRISDEQLNVRTFKGGISIVGLYKEISDAISRVGGKFTKSVYSLLIEKDKEPELVNFKFRGAAFSAWIEKKIDTQRFIIGITETVEGRKGKTVYQIPVFKPFKLTDELARVAIKSDIELQSYLKEYKSKQVEKSIAPEPTDDISEYAEKHDDLQREEMLYDPAKHKSDLNGSDDLPF